MSEQNSEAADRLRAAAWEVHEDAEISGLDRSYKVVRLGDALRECGALEQELEDANAGCIHCGGDGYVGEGDTRGFCPCPDGQVHRLEQENARLVAERDEWEKQARSNQNAYGKCLGENARLTRERDTLRTAIVTTIRNLVDGVGKSDILDTLERVLEQGAENVGQTEKGAQSEALTR